MILFDVTANRVYSGVPAELFGCQQVIEIGPMSGESNVIFWLEQHGLEPRQDLVKRIFEEAKQRNGLLSEAEILGLINSESPKAVRASGPRHNAG